MADLRTRAQQLLEELEAETRPFVRERIADQHLMQARDSGLESAANIVRMHGVDAEMLIEAIRAQKALKE